MSVRLSLGQVTVASFAAEGVLAVAALASTPYLIGMLGTEPYGILAVVSVLAGQLSALQLGIGPAATRRVAECRGRSDAIEQLATLWGALVVALGAGLLVFAISLFAIPWVFSGGLRLSAGVIPIAASGVPACVLLLAVQPVFAAISGALQGEERFAFLVALRLAHGLVRIAVAVAAVGLGRGVPVVLWTQAATDGLAVLIAGNAAGLTRWPRIPAGAIWTSVRALVALGIPFAAAGLLAALLVDVEKLAIAMARSVEDFTYYAVPYNAVFRLSVLAGIVVNVLVPRLSRVAAAGDVQAAASLTRRATRLSVAAFAAAVIPLLAVTPELLALWLGPAFADRAGLLTRILLVGLVVNAWAYPANAAVRARARPSALTLLYALELPFHLLSVYLLVSQRGVVGAAVAWSLRVGVDALAQSWLASRALRSSIGGFWELGASLGASALVALICSALAEQLHWGVRFVGSVTIVGLLLGRTLSPEDRGLIFRALFQRARVEGVAR